VTLYSGLRPADRNRCQRLAAKNIPYEISPDGASVLAIGQSGCGALETAAQGLPRNARLGFELFDTPNWAGSDFSEKVNYQRALEGELERTLQTLSEVDAVRVHLVLPRESLFTEQEHDSKARDRENARRHAFEGSAAAIPQLVRARSTACGGNVTVVVPIRPLLFSRARTFGRASYDSDEELRLRRACDRAGVGSEHVRASVHVDYDLSTSEDTSETFDPRPAQRCRSSIPKNWPGREPGGVPARPRMCRVQRRRVRVTAASTTSPRNRMRRPLHQQEHTAVSQPRDACGGSRRSADRRCQRKRDGKDGKTSTARRKRTPEEMTAIEKLARPPSNRRSAR